jgi:hypothetical protein
MVVSQNKKEKEVDLVMVIENEIINNNNNMFTLAQINTLAAFIQTY